MKVVVVEDNPAINELYQLWLKDNYEVVIVGEHFEQVLVPDFWDGVDAAIIDLLLSSTVTGVDVLDWLHENAPHVRKVVVSALVKVIEKVPHSVADARLVKPFHIDELHEALRGE